MPMMPFVVPGVKYPMDNTSATLLLFHFFNATVVEQINQVLHLLACQYRTEGFID